LNLNLRGNHPPPYNQLTGISANSLQASKKHHSRRDGKRKTTADGRTYFERASDRKITIAYDFSARLEEHLGVSTTEESRRKGSLLKEAEGKGVEIETNLAGLPRGRER
jgi:hypothetical protein